MKAQQRGHRIEIFHAHQRIPATRSFLSKFQRWEWMLVALIILDILITIRLSPFFLDARNLSRTSSDFMEIGLMMLPMVFIIITGNIDLSVASNMGMSASFMGLLHNNGSQYLGGGAGRLIAWHAGRDAEWVSCCPRQAACAGGHFGHVCVLSRHCLWFSWRPGGTRIPKGIYLFGTGKSIRYSHSIFRGVVYPVWQSFLVWFYIGQHLAAICMRLETMKMPPCIPACQLLGLNSSSTPYRASWRRWQA